MGYLQEVSLEEEWGCMEDKERVRLGFWGIQCTMSSREVHRGGWWLGCRSKWESSVTDYVGREDG